MVENQKKIVVGVTGGIAAYKACHIVRAFKEAGDDVTVVPTETALRFVGKATFEALSGNPVSTTVFDAVDEVQHVAVGKQADLIVVAPATADFMARVAAGRADDLLTATILVATCPVVFAPAMHTEMWLNPATQANVHILRSRNIVVLEPDHGRLTGADIGPGRMLEPNHIVELARTVYDGESLQPTLVGKTLLVTAGGTREPIDPVRYIGNRSSGRQGLAIADIAVQRGATVFVVAGHTESDIPSGATVVRVESA
ncbi:MAG: bifunctional phosphopantothenoylcysteine decarboxylase/phosphopantothenate--cysteine ligase CoaBC, partial [Corynebacterium matruchotii]